MFKDVADGILFNKDAIDKERNIVLAEMLVRSETAEKSKNKTKAFYDNYQKFNDFYPIGTKQTLNGATRQSLSAFYKKWYRPQFMHLIVTGEIDEQDIEKQIKQLFSTLKKSKQVKQVAAQMTLKNGISYYDEEDLNNFIQIVMPIFPEKLLITDTQSYQNLLDRLVVKLAI